VSIILDEGSVITSLPDPSAEWDCIWEQITSETLFHLLVLLFNCFGPQWAIKTFSDRCNMTAVASVGWIALTQIAKVYRTLEG
jgi:hypothetical protein